MRSQFLLAAISVSLVLSGIPHSTASIREECILQTPNSGNLSTGVDLSFPRPSYLPNSSNPLKVLVLPVSFKDKKYLDSDLDRAKLDLKKVNSFYSAQSYGKVGVKFNFALKKYWVQVPFNIDDHKLKANFRDYSIGRKYIQEIYDMSSPDLNLSDFDLVLLQTKHWEKYSITQIYPVDHYQTPSGEVNQTIFWSGMAVGDYAALSHEIAHAWLGLVDTYIHPWNKSISEVKERLGVGPWDIMGGYEAQELFAYHRLLAGWLSEDQVFCNALQKSVNEYSISPIEVADGNSKAIITKLSDTKLLVIESRKRFGYDYVADEGILAYTVDSTIPNGMGPINIFKLYRKGKVVKNGLLHRGESLKQPDFKVTFLGNKSPLSKVRIEIY